METTMEGKDEGRENSLRRSATGGRATRTRGTGAVVDVIGQPVTGPSGAAADRMAGEDRYRLIAETAYYRAERRGFAPGRELEDWLTAEIEVDEMLGQAEPRL